MLKLFCPKSIESYNGESMSKIVTVLGDSLAMLRAECNIMLKDIYAYKLAQKLGQEYFVVNNARRANTITEQTGKQLMYDEVLNNNTDIFIIAIGICDCAPRIFSKKQEYILRNLLPNKISKYIIAFKSKYRYFFTKNSPKTWVSLDNFKMQYMNLIEIILNDCKSKKVYLINIADTTEKNNSRSYGFRENISKYNAVLDNIATKYNQNVEVIDFHDITKKNPKLLLEDGIHITTEAHDVLTKILYEKIVVESLGEE